MVVVVKSESLFVLLFISILFFVSQVLLHSVRAQKHMLKIKSWDQSFSKNFFLMFFWFISPPPFPPPSPCFFAMFENILFLEFWYSLNLEIICVFSNEKKKKKWVKQRSFFLHMLLKLCKVEVQCIKWN